MKILMVCLGNICRSPLAEGILQHQIEQHDLDWQVDSAGTGSWHAGQLPDPRSIAIAKKNGLDITQQRARQLVAADLDNYDLVFAMDSSNYQDILRLSKTEEQRQKVKMIMNMERPGYNENVPDPYYGEDGFEEVYLMLVRACKDIIKEWGSSKLSL